MKTIGLALLALALCSCTMNVRMTDINFNQRADGGSTALLSTDASGATNTTETGQTADVKDVFNGMLDKLTEAAKGAFMPNLGSFLPGKTPAVAPAQVVTPVVIPVITTPTSPTTFEELP